MHTRIWVSDISPRSYKKLVPFGICESESDSWSQEERKSEGFLSIVQALGIECSEDTTIEEVSIDILTNSGSLTEVFSEIVNKIGDLNIQSQNREYREILIINLMLFHLGASRIDKILYGLYSDKNEVLRRYDTVLILTKNVDWITGSSKYKDMVKNNLFPSETWVLDIRGYGVHYSLDGTTTEKTFSKEIFHKVLNLDKNNIYRSLVLKRIIILVILHCQILILGHIMI